MEVSIQNGSQVELSCICRAAAEFAMMCGNSLGICNVERNGNRQIEIDMINRWEDRYIDITIDR